MPFKLQCKLLHTTSLLQKFLITCSFFGKMYKLKNLGQGIGVLKSIKKFKKIVHCCKKLAYFNYKYVVIKLIPQSWETLASLNQCLSNKIKQVVASKTILICHYKGYYAGNFLGTTLHIPNQTHKFNHCLICHSKVVRCWVGI